MEPKALRPKKTGPLHETKTTSQAIKPNETQPTSQSHKSISATGTTTVDVATAVHSDASVTSGPTRSADTVPQTIQKFAAGISKWLFPLLRSEPSGASLSDATTQNTEGIRSETQPSENMATARNMPATVMETSTQEVTHQTQTIPDRTSAYSSKPAPKPASTTAPTSTINTTAHAPPTTAPTLPTAAPTTVMFTQAAATTPEEQTESTVFPGSTSPPNTQRLVTLSPNTSLPFTRRETTSMTTTIAAPTTTRQAAENKPKRKVNGDEKEGGEQQRKLEEPMQRQEESTSKKPSKFTFNEVGEEKNRSTEMLVAHLTRR